MTSRQKVPEVPPMSWRQIGQEANALILEHYPKLLFEPGPFPVADFFEFELPAIGFNPAVEELPFGTEAETDFLEKIIKLSEETYSGMLDGNVRARFTVVHEIGHAILHEKYFRGVVTGDRRAIKLNRSKIPAYMDPECQANAFGAALLMPTRHMRNIDSLHDPSEVCDVFKVSYSAAQNRINGLGRY